MREIYRYFNRWRDQKKCHFPSNLGQFLIWGRELCLKVHSDNQQTRFFALFTKSPKHIELQNYSCFKRAWERKKKQGSDQFSDISTFPQTKKNYNFLSNLSLDGSLMISSPKSFHQLWRGRLIGNTSFKALKAAQNRKSIQNIHQMRSSDN